MKYKEYNIKDDVIFVDYEAHSKMPKYYPKVGTKGKVIDIQKDINVLSIQWEYGSTSRDDIWLCDITQVKRV